MVTRVEKMVVLENLDRVDDTKTSVTGDGWQCQRRGGRGGSEG